MKRGLPIWIVVALAVTPQAAAAQEMNASERAQALSRVRAMSDCVERERGALARIMRLIGEAEAQRDAARDARVRHDAERAIEALVVRVASVQQRLRACLSDDLPGEGPDVIVREPPPDPAADAVAQQGGTVRTVERDARLADQIQVVRGEQVDGQGRLDAEVVQRGVRTIASRLSRCYERYLDRGTIDARQLNLVFTLRGSGRAQRVDVERSGFSDRAFERCVRSAGQRLRFSRGPQGGEAIYSYTLRFGR